MHQLTGYENGGAGDAVGRAVKEIRAVASYDEAQNFGKRSDLSDADRLAADLTQGFPLHDSPLQDHCSQRLWAVLPGTIRS